MPRPRKPTEARARAGLRQDQARLEGADCTKDATLCKHGLMLQHCKDSSEKFCAPILILTVYSFMRCTRELECMDDDRRQMLEEAS